MPGQLSCFRGLTTGACPGLRPSCPFSSRDGSMVYHHCPARVAWLQQKHMSENLQKARPAKGSSALTRTLEYSSQTLHRHSLNVPSSYLLLHTFFIHKPPGGPLNIWAAVLIDQNRWEDDILTSFLYQNNFTYKNNFFWSQTSELKQLCLNYK